MRTPAGHECHFYFQDFHREINVQECRLLKRASVRWRPHDCNKCIVPDILWANASPDLQLKALIRPGLLGLGRRVEVTASCRKHQSEIADPYVGCEQCAAEGPDLSSILDGSSS